ncbi:MAG TPA: hypothetical protein VE933_09120 [Chitinophagaceae bacterium]|nr:hypothetical protein [Chitinophagaceae bacterium]
MKKTLLNSFLLITLLFAFNFIYPQKKTSSTPEERAGKMTGWMKTNLQLSDSQVLRVQDINLEYAKKTQGLQTTTLSRKEKMQVLKDNDKAKDAELKNVFTTDQYNAYQVKKEEIRKQMKERMRDKKTHGKMT